MDDDTASSLFVTILKCDDLDLELICQMLADVIDGARSADTGTVQVLTGIAQRALDEVTDRELKALRALEVARERRGEPPEPTEKGVARLISGVRFGMCCSLWEAVLSGTATATATGTGTASASPAEQNKNKNKNMNKNALAAASMLVDAIMSFVACMICDPELRMMIEAENPATAKPKPRTICAIALSALMRDHVEKLLDDARMRLIRGGAEYVEHRIDATPGRLLKDALLDAGVYVDVTAAMALAVRRLRYTAAAALKGAENKRKISPDSVRAMNALSDFMAERRGIVRALHVQQGRPTHRMSLTVMRAVLLVVSNSGLLRLHREIGLA